MSALTQGPSVPDCHYGSEEATCFERSMSRDSPHSHLIPAAHPAGYPPDMGHIPDNMAADMAGLSEMKWPSLAWNGTQTSV